jgi:broad specificity phosphatase PhoE
VTACTIHLVRHGEHGLLGQVLAGRVAGVALSAAGAAQAGALAARFGGDGVRAVLTSPVQRARETAAPIAAALGLDVQVEAGLEEIDFGAWAGQRFDALDALPAWHEWNRARGLASTPGGETMLAAQARAVAALMRLRGAGGVVVAVSHSDIIKAVLAYALGMPLDLLHRLEVAPGSRSILTLGDDFARVEAVNLPT